MSVEATILSLNEMKTFFETINTFNSTLIKWDNDLNLEKDIKPSFKDELIKLSKNIKSTFDKINLYIKQKQDEINDRYKNLKHKTERIMKEQNEFKFTNKSKGYNNLLFYGYIRESNYYNKLGNDILTILFDIFLSMKIAKNGTLIIKENQKKTLKSDYHYEFEKVIIKSGAQLTVKPWDSQQQNGGKLLIHSLSNIIIEENASINLNGLGYRGGTIEGTQGESIYGIGVKSYKPNYGGGGGGNKDSEYYEYGGNASYGSKGIGSEDKAYSGKTYGDKYLTNLYLGSGGGGSTLYGWDDNGGNGGGALYLYSQQTICINGNINADGIKGGQHGGAGSGGSIHIKTKDFEMGKNASIKAIGYKWWNSDGSTCYKEGGDGRIRIDCKNKKSHKKKMKYIDTFNIKPSPFWGKFNSKK